MSTSKVLDRTRSFVVRRKACKHSLVHCLECPFCCFAQATRRSTDAAQHTTRGLFVIFLIAFVYPYFS